MPGRKQRYHCGICGTTIFGTRYHLDRHTKTHTGAPHLLPGGTRNDGVAQRKRWQLKAKELMLLRNQPEEMQLILDMSNSRPRSVRFRGGLFDAGALQDKRVFGRPDYFNEEGQLKQKYEFLRSFPIGQRISIRLALGPTWSSTSLPRPSSQVHSYGNRRWTPLDDNERGFTELATNLWTPHKYAPWATPDGQDANANDPTVTHQHERACDLCHSPPQGCDCITSRVPQDLTPAVVQAGAMGEGTQARRQYRIGDLLRELVGELAPLGQYEDGWAADLARHDGSGTLAKWCLVYPRYCGNWARKMNHSCEFNTEFVSMKVSGRWRVMVRAVAKIQVGAWVTVNYGDEYWDGPGETCLCGSERCVSRMGRGEDMDL